MGPAHSEVNVLQAAEATLHMAALHSELHTKGRATCLGMVLPLMPLILASGSLEQQALLHSTLAELYMQDRAPADFAQDAAR